MVLYKIKEPKVLISLKLGIVTNNNHILKFLLILNLFPTLSIVNELKIDNLKYLRKYSKKFQEIITYFRLQSFDFGYQLHFLFIFSLPLALIDIAWYNFI